ncbi:MAG: AAA family ATPase [Halanaerobiales bacterium]|nr:AAA family ATPase [Halanaerobiales bacterium]
MKLPNNISDFGVIRQENYLYIDKTKYIEELEKAGRYLFFIRPRRFGKSLFLSTLEHYYDLKSSQEFERLFNGLYIGKNPTELKNRYFILKLNFSGLDTINQDGLRESFEGRFLSMLITFFEYYHEYFPKAEEIIQELKESNITRQFGIFFGEVAKTKHKVYLIIDEYDHFANDIIAMGDDKYYRDTVRASSFVRDFYENIKIGTQGIIDRIFMTGIAPIMLDDLTSGFNITSNVTMDSFFNEMLGFTEEEVSEIIEQVEFDFRDLKMKNLEDQLRDYYNGYLFNEDCDKRVYNPDMILYFFQYFLRHKKPPKELISENVKTDYSRLKRLTFNQKNREILENIIKDEGITASIVSKFSFDMMYDQKYFVSLLFYMGLLTIDKKIRTRLFLKIPNLIIKTIFWEYFDQILRERYQLILNVEKLSEAIEAMAYEGEIELYLDFISENVLSVLSNRDLISFDEKYLKLILSTYLNLVEIYKCISEAEVENGYIDIFLEKDIRFQDVKYEWIWELKYLKKSEANKLEEVKEKGLAQLKRYASSNRFKFKKNLKQALIIFIGKDTYEVVLS